MIGATLVWLLLQGDGWTASPSRPTVGDTIRLERTVPAPGGWRLRTSKLFVEDRLLDERGAAAAVLLRPGQPRPSSLVQPLLPRAAKLERRLDPRWLPAWVVRLEPRADLVAEPFLSR